MTLAEIKEAVQAGKVVHWGNEGYRVIYSERTGEYLIQHRQGHCIGLTWADGVTMNGREDEFFTADAGPVEFGVYVYPNCYVYADKKRELCGDYFQIGRLFYSPLQCVIYDNSPRYAEVHQRMNEDFMRLSQMTEVEISATGQTAKITH